MAPKKGPGRPRKDTRPGTATHSIRFIDHEVWHRLHMYAAEKKLTVGEAFNEIVRKVLQ